MKELPKTYSPRDVESKWIKYWKENNFFTPDTASQKPKFSIVIPPPNVTGNLTVGHILNNTIQDIYARWKRMSGFNVLWLPGTDHAGIATQTVVEKELKKEKLDKHILGRKKFVEKVWQWKEAYRKNIEHQLTTMGASVDWTRERFTMDEGLSYAVRKVFVDLYKKGLIYKGKRIINWDPDAQTALSDEEVIYKEKKDKLYYIRYPLINGSGPKKYITIATTRPESMLGDTAVAVHPEDKRYKDLIGKKILLPVAERVIPIIADVYVDKEFGTGALKITPAHDPNDFEIGQRHNLAQLQVIDQSGRMNQNAGKYSGLDRFEARKQIISELEKIELLEKIEDYVHNIGYSERGNAIVEPYLSDQWFVSMKSLAPPALDAVLSGKIRFYPERWVKVYEHWMTNIKDWCISRQLWWGHQIPVWYNKVTGEQYCGMVSPFEGGKGDETRDSHNWEQDPDVLDTWFSSWLWSFSAMGWPEKTNDYKIFFPTDLLSTGPDIIFFWVARMIMASLEFTGEIPFSDVYFHNIIRDEKGKKLSKSLGNSPDVIDVMNEYGTDALRFTLVYLAPQGVDVYFSKDKCEIGRNFANKIWNASRFLFMKRNEFSGTEQNSEEYPADIFDSWIKSRINSTIKNYLKALNEYKINEASKWLYEFIWGDFCDWYIEILKIKSNEQPQFAGIMFSKAFEVFEKILKLLHPVMPFITEELWQSLADRKPGESISLSEFPKLNESLISIELEEKVKDIQELITAIRNLRAELNLSPSVKCDVLINCKDTAEKKFINNLSNYIIPLSKIGNLDITLPDEFAKIPKFQSLTSIVNNFQVYIKTEGLIDINKEKERLNKEIERVESFLSSLDKKLSNQNFLKKASDDVVNSEKRKQEDFRSKLEKLKSHYKSLSN